jgi:hypothetical protein
LVTDLAFAVVVEQPVVVPTVVVAVTVAGVGIGRRG